MGRRKINNFQGRNFSRKRSVDRLTDKARSTLMSRIRSKNTLFEQDFIKALKKETSLRFSLNVASLKGKPDIVFKKQKVCVFLDSDFWHGWQYPRWKHLLKDDFWRNKIEQNRRRDRRNSAHLKRSGWRIVRLWEHNIKGDLTDCVQRILSLLSQTE